MLSVRRHQINKYSSHMRERAVRQLTVFNQAVWCLQRKRNLIDKFVAAMLQCLERWLLGVVSWWMCQLYDWVGDMLSTLERPVKTLPTSTMICPCQPHPGDHQSASHTVHHNSDTCLQTLTNLRICLHTLIAVVLSSLSTKICRKEVCVWFLQIQCHRQQECLSWTTRLK